MRAAFAEVIAQYGDDTKRAELGKKFSLCKVPEPGTDALTLLVDYIQNAFTTYAMTDYPYPNDLIAPVPAFPINFTCNLILQDGDLIENLAAAIFPVYNTGGQCIDLASSYIVCADKTGCGTGNDGYAWDFQACTREPYLASSNNVTDMFPPNLFDLDALTAYCQRVWNVIPDPFWFRNHYGQTTLNGASNIIFSNGLVDPWHVGGFLTIPGDGESRQLFSVINPTGAHHYDLRGSNPLDSADVIIARQTEMKLIGLFIDQARENKKKAN